MTGIPVCLWFLSKGRHGNGHRERRGEVLFIDARSLGRMETRTLRVLDDADVARISEIYRLFAPERGVPRPLVFTRPGELRCAA